MTPENELLDKIWTIAQVSFWCHSSVIFVTQDLICITEPSSGILFRILNGVPSMQMRTMQISWRVLIYIYANRKANQNATYAN